MDCNAGIVATRAKRNPLTEDPPSQDMIEQPASFLDTLLRSSRKLELDYEQASQDAPESAARVRATVAKFLDGYAAFNQISPEAAAASYMTTVRSYASHETWIRRQRVLPQPVLDPIHVAGRFL